MILQQLYADSDAIFRQTDGDEDEALPSMYNRKRIRWEVRLYTDGRITEFFPLTGDGKGGERGILRPVPDCKRTVGIRPILGADKTAYTLGIKVADPKQDAGRNAATDAMRTAKEHAAFKALVAICAEANPVLAPVAAFLSGWDPANPLPALPPGLTRDDMFEFTVDGKRVVEAPQVQAFWASYGRDDTAPPTIEAVGEGNADSPTQCLVSGLRGPVEEMMPLVVKGIPGGQPAGMHIVSANAPAFESYGLKRAQTSPISRDAGERFGKALNALIASPRHRRSTGNITYVFWSRQKTVPLPAFDPEFGDAMSVRELIDFIRSGKAYEGIPDDARFHLFGLSPNAARVVVRSALDTTIGEIKERQADWFARLEMVGNDGLPGKPLPLKTLAVAPYREFKNIAPGVEDALVRAALAGDRLPESLLQSVVMRCRLDTENRVTYPRAALLKYLLTQDPKPWPLEEAKLMTQEISGELPPALTPKQSGAYHCGRLFAELEDIQKRAIVGINATISDRYFGAASSAPATVFGTLLSGARDHLGKLRRSQEGAYFGAESRLEEIMAQIEDFPLTLTLREQALFSLGYYHHKAAKRKDIAERSAAKKQAGTLALDLAESLADALAASEPAETGKSDAA